MIYVLAVKGKVNFKLRITSYSDNYPVQGNKLATIT